MIIQLDTDNMTISFGVQQSDAEESNEQIAGNIATLISVLSAHQAMAFFDDEDNRLYYLFTLISNANNILKQADKVQQQSLDNFDIDDESDIDFEEWESFLRKYFDGEDGDDDYE